APERESCTATRNAEKPTRPARDLTDSFALQAERQNALNAVAGSRIFCCSGQPANAISPAQVPFVQARQGGAGPSPAGEGDWAPWPLPPEGRRTPPPSRG